MLSFWKGQVTYIKSILRRSNERCLNTLPPSPPQPYINNLVTSLLRVHNKIPPKPSARNTGMVRPNLHLISNGQLVALAPFPLPGQDPMLLTDPAHNPPCLISTLVVNRCRL